MADETFSDEQLKAVNNNSKHILVTARAWKWKNKSSCS